jgi:hypothetical protein
MGFSGYIVFGLIVGLSYEKITKVLPAFIIMYGECALLGLEPEIKLLITRSGLMQSSGNFGPGNMEGTISAEASFLLLLLQLNPCLRRTFTVISYEYQGNLLWYQCRPRENRRSTRNTVIHPYQRYATHPNLTAPSPHSRLT